MVRMPTYLDRYPAKMISRLADKLVSRFAIGRLELMDPFCGSGAILAAGKKKGIYVTGFDINPYAVLLSRVKLHGFNREAAQEICDEFITRAERNRRLLPIEWNAKDFWFTEATVRKYEQLRYVADKMHLNGSSEGRAVLLAYALSIRRCSRADQRSPKPFVSKTALRQRKGRHFDPLTEIRGLFEKLAQLYGEPAPRVGRVACVDIIAEKSRLLKTEKFPLVITSPPYLNAQDYFRNFKLELNLLEQLLPFNIDRIRTSFIGTERGLLLEGITQEILEHHEILLPKLRKMKTNYPRLAAVVHRYLYDMGRSFDSIRSSLENNALLVIAGGDNLVAGYSISTWRVLNAMLEERGFILFDTFGDHIDRRCVPPKRNGHKGLIKQEVISAFRFGH